MTNTSKFHIENIIFLPIIKFLWEPFSGKRSHWWNWSKIERNFNKSIFVKGDNKLHSLNNQFDKLIQLNFLWKNMVILEPSEYKGEYLLAYENNYGKEICSMILQGKTACLIGNENTKYTGFSYPEMEEVQLSIRGYANKKNLPKEILFL